MSPLKSLMSRFWTFFMENALNFIVSCIFKVEIGTYFQKLVDSLIRGEVKKSYINGVHL
jgi:hypothetical protein